MIKVGFYSKNGDSIKVFGTLHEINTFFNVSYDTERSVTLNLMRDYANYTFGKVEYYLSNTSLNNITNEIEIKYSEI